jgi:poly(hydroxyalkanoate) depolymerase family esterase
VTALPDEKSFGSNASSAPRSIPQLPWPAPYLMVSRFGKRPFLVYIPKNYKVGTSVPLVVMLHGCSQTPRGSAIGTQWNDLADEHNFIVVYPAQTIEIVPSGVIRVEEQPTEGELGEGWRDGNIDRCWNWFLPRHQGRDAGEPAVIADITRAVMDNTTTWTIDPSRVYVAGMSAGGAMAVVLGATYPDLFRAVGVHSGVEYKAATDGASAFQVLKQGGPDPVSQGQQAFQAMGEHARLMPTIVLHGSRDLRVNPINGEQVVRQWLETNRLACGGSFNGDFNNPTFDDRFDAAVPAGHPYRIRTWSDNDGRTVQEFWTIEDMAHAWSGGYWSGSFADSRGPSASRAMYSFFSRH